MKNTKMRLLCIAMILFALPVFSQNINQTVRGTIKDIDGNFELAGAPLSLQSAGNQQFAMSDANGNCCRSNHWTFSRLQTRLFNMDWTMCFK